MLSIPLTQRNLGRRSGPPDAIVIHWSAGSGNAEAVGGYFQRNPSRKASYHRAIGRDGVTAEMVDLGDIAWHAGDGDVWDDGPPLNDRSVGLCMCLLGNVSARWAAAHPGRAITAKHAKPGVKSTQWERPTPEMIAELRRQIAEVAAACPSIRYVLGHDDATKGKIDPGPTLNGVDLGLDALGLTRLRRRWDLKGAPWEGLDAPTAPTPAPFAPTPQAPAQAAVVVPEFRAYEGPLEVLECIEPPPVCLDPNAPERPYVLAYSEVETAGWTNPTPTVSTQEIEAMTSNGVTFTINPHGTAERWSVCNCEECEAHRPFGVAGPDDERVKPSRSQRRGAAKPGGK